MEERDDSYKNKKKKVTIKNKTSHATLPYIHTAKEKKIIGFKK